MNATFYVSPNHTQGEMLSGEVGHLDIFADQVNGWVFDQATALLHSTNRHWEQSAIAVLMLTTSYFEAIGEFIRGEDSDRRSPEFFKVGFRDVFPVLGDTQGKDLDASQHEMVASAIYKELRCGLFHNAHMRRRVWLYWRGAFPDPRAIITDLKENGEIAQIRVEPSFLLVELKAHFRRYVDAVRSATPESEVSRNFEAAFALRMGGR
jgi:hypothetical protein